MTTAQRVQRILDEAVGRVCNKCSGTDFYRDGKCKPCKKADSLKRYYANQKESQAKSREYANAHKEERKLYIAEYRLKNKTRLEEVCKKWRSENLTHISARNKEWRTANIDKARSDAAKYRREHPEAKRISEHNRRVRQKNNGGRLSRGLSTKLYRLQRGKCACCGAPLGRDYHLDHRMPIALGGANEDWNIQLLRKKCNHEKSAKHPVDFMQSRGFLL